ncbi:MAG: hypothetical protein ACTHKG_14290 [Nocardioides sp.]
MPLRRVLPAALTLLLAAPVAALAPAAATPTASATTGATARTTTAPALRAVITFDKSQRNPQRSRLHWRVFRVQDGGRTLLEHRSWRAGSGFTRHSTNACRRNDGWLPNGYYAPRLHANYHGSLIKGRAIFLGAKRCANGTLRTDLFIHTEQGDRNSQCPDRPGDQVCRWEYPKIDDYRSWGCIKLRPRDLRELYDAWLRRFDLGADPRVRVRVVS